MQKRATLSTGDNPFSYGVGGEGQAGNRKNYPYEHIQQVQGEGDASEQEDRVIITGDISIMSSAEANSDTKV